VRHCENGANQHQAAAESTLEILNEILNKFKNTTDAMRQSTAIAQQNVNMGKEARAADRVAGTEIIREIKNKGLQSQTNG